MRHYRYSWKMHFLYSIVLLFVVVPSFFADEAWSRDAWSDAAHLCHAPDGFAFASKGPIDTKVNPDDCDDGDSTIFNGLLCASGDKRGCEAVKRSLTTEAGLDESRMWRSPRRAQTNNLHRENGSVVTGDSGEHKTFSPDQELGLLLYAVTTGDKSSLERWFNWLDHNRPWADQATKVHNVPRYCHHQNCTMRPIDRDMDDAVFRALGGESPDGIRNYKLNATLLTIPITMVVPGVQTILQLYLNMSVGDKIYYEATLNAPNFPTHLSAIRAWLLVKIQHPNQGRAKETIAMIANKQPKNPFYQYLHEGATPKVAALVKKYCPAPSQSRGGDLGHWTWESDSSDWKVPAKIDNGKPSSMLWDCIFMRNLLGDHGKGLGIQHTGTENAISGLLLGE